MPSNVMDVFKRIWIVSGTVTEENTLMPLKGLTVVAEDFDHLHGDECLGKAVTDEKGRYCIIFTWDNYYDVLEFLPDVYVKVYTPDKKLLKDTRSEVPRNISASKEINIQIAMADMNDKQPVYKSELKQATLCL